MTLEPSAGNADATRTGYVTLVGHPNVGKSTLLNALVGERLSIVTAKAQTTWGRVTGIRTHADTQMVFLDTPGLLRARDLLQQSMLGTAQEAVREADVLVLVLDLTRPVRDIDPETMGSILALTRAPRLAALNKSDAVSREKISRVEDWARRELSARPFVVSATKGDGLPELIEALEAELPEAPFLYPRDDLASQPVRFFVAELVRETVLEQYHQEIPYSVICMVEEFREAQDPVYIGVSIFVERASQKGMLIGKSGSAIKTLGKEARAKIEHFLDRTVYLDLWVKVLPGWRRKRHHLRKLGFHVPDDADGKRR